MTLLTKAMHRVLVCLLALALAMPLWVLAQQAGSAKVSPMRAAPPA